MAEHKISKRNITRMDAQVNKCILRYITEEGR